MVRFDPSNNPPDLFEGDLVRDATARFPVASERRRWPRGVVPYVVHEDLLRPNGEAPSKIRNAIRQYETKTNVRFAERAGEDDYAEFIRGPGCYSRVGMQGGRQEISVGSGCGQDAVVHEIGHLLGAFHMHSRSDRDGHVVIHWDEIEPSKRHNFSFQGGELIGEFDLYSVMLYSSYAWSATGNMTMTQLDGSPVPDISALSLGDVARFNALYPEPVDPPVEPPDPPDPPEPDPHLLVLYDRFEIRGTWTTAASTGQITWIPLDAIGSDRNGLGFFYDRKSWELFVRMTAHADGFGVGIGTATSQEWRVVISDTETEADKVYEWQGGGLSPAVDDWGAFPD